MVMVARIPGTDSSRWHNYSALAGLIFRVICVKAIHIWPWTGSRSHKWNGRKINRKDNGK